MGERMADVKLPPRLPVFWAGCMVSVKLLYGFCKVCCRGEKGDAIIFIVCPAASLLTGGRRAAKEGADIMAEGPAGRPATTIAQKLLLCLIGSILIPMILLAAGLGLKLVADYSATARAQMQASLNQVAEYVQSYFQQLNAVTAAPYYHSYFSARESLDPAAPDYRQRVAEIQSEMRQLLDLTSFSRSDIADIFLWSDGQMLYYSFYNELDYFSLDVPQQPWYRAAQQSGGRMAVSPCARAVDDGAQPLDTSSFYVTRRIRNLRAPEQDSLIFLNVLSQPFSAYCRDLPQLYDSFLVLTNETGELIFASRELTGAAAQQVLAGGAFRYDGSRWSTLTTALEDPALQVHIVYSLDDMGRQLWRQLAGIAAIYLVGLAVVLALYRRLNRWIPRPTAPLLNTCERLEQGDLQTRCPPLEVQEFQQIGLAVNHMTDRLNEKIEKEYLLTIRQKTVQLRALQAQIQPHFLINTLYCFITLNQIGARERLNAGFFSLANLLRYVLSKEYDTTLGQELDFMQDYLKLQQMRFGERLNFSIHCPDRFRGLRMPRMLLQPLVENAVIHGIEPCEHPCLCRITADWQAGVLTIAVEDNGVGFDAQQLARKQAEEAEHAARLEAGLDDGQPRRVSVGLHYVRERLRMWRPDADLQITRTDVTRAALSIPWKEEVPYEHSDRG